MADSLGSRIRDARLRAGLSQHELARRVRIRQPSLQAIESGKVRGTKHLVEIAHALDVTPEMLLGQKSPGRQAALPRDLPVHEGPICGENGAFEFDVQRPADYVPRPPRLADATGAYALYVHGDSMEPWREPGQIVYVHPTQPPRLNDYVVVVLKAKGPGATPPAYLKRLVGQNGKEIRLLQYNPRKYLTFQRSQIARIQRVLDPSELLGA